VPEPWQFGNVPGSLQANAITDSKIIVAMIKNAKHPLLVIGSQVFDTVLGKSKTAKLIEKLHENRVQIVATANMKEFAEEGFRDATWMGVVDITNRLTDPAWMGVDGRGQHDLVLFIGVVYYLQSQMLSTLKHFAPQLKTIALDRYYHPNANWSFSLSEDDWRKKMDELMNQV
jgi:acetyl-CoA decarbonylase/synthase complex subunit epsilon